MRKFWTVMDYLINITIIHDVNCQKQKYQKSTLIRLLWALGVCAYRIEFRASTRNPQNTDEFIRNTKNIYSQFQIYNYAIVFNDMPTITIWYIPIENINKHQTISTNVNIIKCQYKQLTFNKLLIMTNQYNSTPQWYICVKLYVHNHISATTAAKTSKTFKKRLSQSSTTRLVQLSCAKRNSNQKIHSFDAYAQKYPHCRTPEAVLTSPQPVSKLISFPFYWFDI